MWLYVPSTCCPSAPGSGCSTSASSSLCRRLERSATWRGKHIASKSWQRACGKASWMTALFGRLLKPSTAKRGVASWISSLRACPVSPTPSPASSAGTKTSEPSGPPSCASSETFNPNWCSSKTYQPSFSIFDPSETHFTDWAIGLRRDYSRRMKLARARRESGSSALRPGAGAIPMECREADQRGKTGSIPVSGIHWQTPQLPNGGGKTRGGGRQDEFLLEGQAAVWEGQIGKNQIKSEPGHASSVAKSPTTIADSAGVLFAASDCANASECQTSEPLTSSGTISPESTQLWMTPHGMAGVDHTGHRGAGGEFAKQVSQWGTPNSHERTQTPRDVDHGEQLANQVDLWPSPVARSPADCPAERARNSPAAAAAAASVFMETLPENWATPKAADLSHQAQATESDGQPSSPNVPGSRPRLNPAFVAWLQGIPWWWTSPESISFAPSEMALYLCAQRRHLSFCLGD